MTTVAEIDRSDDALAAEYVLGVLPHDERTAFAGRLESSRDLQSRVRFWDDAMLPVSRTIAAEAPPDRVFKAIQARLFGEAPADVPHTAGWWNSIRLWRGLALASVAAVAILVGTNRDLFQGPPDAGATYVAELTGESGAVRMVALFDSARGELRLNRTEGTAPTQRDFELWLIVGQNAPISLGVLPESNDGVIAVPEELHASFENAVLAISDEPEGGSPTGSPTGDVLAVGQVSSI